MRPRIADEFDFVVDHLIKQVFTAFGISAVNFVDTLSAIYSHGHSFRRQQFESP